MRTRGWLRRGAPQFGERGGLRVCVGIARLGNPITPTVGKAEAVRWFFHVVLLFHIAIEGRKINRVV